MKRRTAIRLLPLAVAIPIVAQTKKIKSSCWAGTTGSGADRFIPCGEAEGTQAVWTELNVDSWKGIRITKGDRIIEIPIEEIWSALTRAA